MIKYGLSTIGLVFSILLGSAVYADSGDEAAKAFIDNNAKKVISILDSGEGKKDKLKELFSEVIDYEWMAKFVLARYWQTLGASEQQEFQKVYKNYIMSLYVPKYTEYNKNRYSIYASNPLGNGVYIVSMNVTTKSSAPIKIEYRIKDFGGKFKIRDIIAEDVSLIATQRADFSSYLSSSNIEGLIANLKQKSGG